MDTSILFLGVFFGAIGLGFFTYGKKQKKIIPLCAGLGLFVCPYFVSNIYMLVLVGLVLSLLPYFIRV